MGTQVGAGWASEASWVGGDQAGQKNRLTFWASLFKTIHLFITYSPLEIRRG